MEHFDEIVSNAIEKYFNSLSLVGYRNYDDVYKIIYLTMIQYILCKFKEYITDEDLMAIVNSVYCIADDCLIDFPSSLDSSDLLNCMKKDLSIRKCLIALNL